MAPSLLLPLTVLLGLLLLSTPASASKPKPKCRPPRPLSKEFCSNPPVVSNFSLPAYTGRWYQIYTSGVAGRFSVNRCVTANYTAQSPSAVGVLNCQFPATASRPVCVDGVAKRRPGETPANLAVFLAPGRPAGPYNVVATLGFASYGYYAAAVFSCRNTEQGPEGGFFIIARTPYKPQSVIRVMKKKLRCLGFQLDDRFIKTRHPPKCRYFDGPKGFEIGPIPQFG